MQLNDGARVQPGIHSTRQSDTPKRRRAPQVAHAPQKLRSIRGNAVRFFVGSQKCYAPAKLTVKAITGEQSMFFKVELGHDMSLMCITSGTQYPFGVVGDGNTACTLP